MILTSVVAAVALGCAGPSDDTSTWYESSIQPFFESYCVRCHGETRRKGDLALHTLADLQAGGFDGAVFVAGDAAASTLIQRLRLDADHEEHMPPSSKSQPSAAEIAGVAAWIDAGADVQAAAPTVASEPSAPTRPPIVIDAPFPDELVESLRAEYVHIEVIDPALRGVWIDFAARPSADDAWVARLAPLAPFVLELSLAGTEISDAAFEHIAAMPHLDRLDVARTACTSQGLARLGGHAFLRTLVLTGTSIDADAGGTLASLPALERVFVWKTPWTDDATAALLVERPDLRVVTAAVASAIPLETEPPPEFTRIPELPAVNTLCPVSGAPVDTRFRIAHDGQIIAFCCTDCAVTFWQAPDDYAVQP